MSSPQIEAQNLVTERVTQLLEFDFTGIGGSGSVYISDSKESTISGEAVLTWDGNTYNWCDFKMSGIRCDLTGQVANPTLTVAADTLWADAVGWASKTSSLNMMGYRGLIVKRQRLFYNTPTLVAPQRYFVDSVDTLDATMIVFTLTPSLGSENLKRPSARKLEI